MANDRPTHHRLDDLADLGIDGLSEVSLVGSGGSSTVYRAHQESLDRVVAVKVMHAAWSMETRERFEHEREVMGRLTGHAAIVPVLQTGVTARGEPYLLMPFYGRGSLFRLMQDRGPLPWREASYLLEAVSQAVADGHAAGVVHRDVKPGNVLLTDNLQPRLCDFGIALPGGTVASGSAVAYTPSYSPPEAFEAGPVRPTVDVYSLGATLWALLAGRAPFAESESGADPAEMRSRSLAGEIGPPARSTPTPLHRFLVRAMAPDPTRRPETAAMFAAELRRAIRLSERPGDPSDGPGGNRRDLLIRAALIAVIGAGLALIVGAGLWLLR